MYKYFIYLLLIFNTQIMAQSQYKKYLETNIEGRANKDGVDKNGKSNPSRSENCNTEGFHDTQTAVTFWGDSRIDLVDHLFYGMSSLDAYMSAAGNGWNVQNFGVIARQSQGLLDEIKECFKRETDYIEENIIDKSKGGDITKPYYTNFKVSRNVAFEIGEQL